MSMQRESAPFPPPPPASVFSPNKFSSAPPITSSYFLSGTPLRKQSEPRVTRAVQPAAHTAERGDGRERLRQTDTQPHTHTHTNICALCRSKHLQCDTSCRLERKPSEVPYRSKLSVTHPKTKPPFCHKQFSFCCFPTNEQ